VEVTATIPAGQHRRGVGTATTSRRSTCWWATRRRSGGSSRSLRRAAWSEQMSGRRPW